MLVLDIEHNLRRKSRRFYFDKRWLEKDGVKEVIERVWTLPIEGSPMHRVSMKIKACRMELNKWSRTQMLHSAKQIEIISKAMDEMKEEGDQRDWQKWKELKALLDKAYEEEESYWYQKSRNSWLKEGDKNSKFFHATTVQRRKSNGIESLEREDGTWCEGEQEVETEIEGFYKELFASEDKAGWEETLDGIPCTITDQMNTTLIRPIEDAEIKGAVFSMNPHKAPGIDECMKTTSFSLNINGESKGYIKPTRGIRDEWD
ncbi:OLC1v1036114C2 [Oldenlandia corymbosa var. corymbosa]|uniref:OLC1v1036114C2 n=1 Tax=Oldenlandia corymbosa var. corymbosa TaxID=529605 RepID=A0AAV1CUM7_OLDCO|nr:OLC1v1036114C2 [Oldenlandia corymbosa var. corymbosa]